jgi:ferric-dicitrate binding protein FerR (iron transport regulator)
MDTDLLIKYMNGECSDQEKITIINWLDSDPKHMSEFMALRKLNDISIWQTTATENKKVKKSKPSLKQWYIEVLKYAAILLIAFISCYCFFSNPEQEIQTVMQTIDVPAGQRVKVTLVDGTTVWLNAKTKLTFPNQFSENVRNVTIDGEGFFDVSHNESKPFIVNTDKYNIKVLGTKFNLMAYSEKEIFKTSLLEGAVEILYPGCTKGINIKPNEQISLKNNQLVISPISCMNHFLWKDGIISFNNESFPEMAEKLELYFDLKIEIKNDKILNYKCTGKFRTKDGVEHILKVLQLSNKFRYSIDDKLNIITIN